MKTAIVTGSSRGIGAATAALLAREGWAVCINYIEQRLKAEALTEKLRGEGCTVMCVQADVSSPKQVKAMVDRVHEELGSVSLLVNNAGISSQKMFQDTDFALWKRMFEVNTDGCFNCTQAVLPDMLHVHSGCIVNVASIWGINGCSCESAYAATKHAVVGLSKSLASELAPSGIRVNCVAPGAIFTDMAKSLGEDTIEYLNNEIPMGRMGRPEEVAQAILHLVNAEYTTGQVLCMDGGFTL